MIDGAVITGGIAAAGSIIAAVISNHTRENVKDVRRIVDRRKNGKPNTTRHRRRRKDDDDQTTHR